MLDKIVKPLMLITRPSEDALPLAEQLQGLGCDVWAEPMIAIDIKHKQAQSLADLLDMPPQAIVITSANGMRALCALTPNRTIKLITVGPASRDEAQLQGFSHIDMAKPEYGGDVNGLVRHISENYTADGGMLLHISGNVVAGDLVGQLKTKGLPANHIALYNAQAASKLSAEVRNGLKEKTINSVLFYSPRTADIFIELIKNANLIAELSALNCYCLSNNVAEKFKDISFKNIHIAKNPTGDDMLLLIKSKL
jgi:uroporphyrinogen-III synthase